MKTLTLHIPDNIDLDDEETVLFLASHLYEQGKISLGQGAEMTGRSKREFMQRLGDYGVSVINYPASDLERDANNARRYHI